MATATNAKPKIQRLALIVLRKHDRPPRELQVAFVRSKPASARPAVARAGQKQHDQKNDRGRNLVNRDEEKGQPAHRAGTEEDEVAINEQRENGGRGGYEQSGDSSATAASSKKTCAGEER